MLLTAHMKGRVCVCVSVTMCAECSLGLSGPLSILNDSDCNRGFILAVFD